VEIPTEPIGSIPRPEYLRVALGDYAAGRIDSATLAEYQDEALADTIERFERTGSPVITDGEQGKPDFATYPLAGLRSLAADGMAVPFGGRRRRLPRLVAGPFRYRDYADEYLVRARTQTSRPIKQAVVAPSAMSLLYPEDGVEGYSREQFLADLVDEAETDIRRCLAAEAECVQVDFTEARLSHRLDPSGRLLKEFVELNNSVLDRFTAAERARIGVHTCPGGMSGSARDIGYPELVPMLFDLHVGRFYLRMAGEREPCRVLDEVRRHRRPEQRVFVGVTDPADPRVEPPELVRDRVLLAADYIPADRLGSCDDCGFSPFADDDSTSREIAFAKIASRVTGTGMAEEQARAS
jgi:5-methyltetrahydropteroyltriglutamate--homocysteine methyltransferase